MKKEITINDLAIMVQKGFNEVTENMATKTELNSLEGRVNKRFDKIEKLILEDYRKRIERLESEMRDLRETFAM
jgi:hypothetical protein